MSDITTAEEGAEALMMAMLLTFADEPDETPLPLREFIVEIGRACGVEMLVGDRLNLEEEITVGELRRRMLVGRTRLAEAARILSEEGR